jgi:hypothetical protein
VLHEFFVARPGPRRCLGAYASFTDKTKLAVSCVQLLPWGVWVQPGDAGTCLPGAALEQQQQQQQPLPASAPVLQQQLLFSALCTLQ